MQAPGQQAARAPLVVTNRGVQLRTLEDCYRVAKAIANSQLCPQAFKGKPDDCLVAIQMGLEVGIAPLAALQNIAVINGRPSIWGDAALAVCMGSGVFDFARFREYQEGDGDGWVARCRVARVGGYPVERSFSVADAKRAGLWGKAGTWQQYPQRMLQMRARSWALRDCFADALRGLNIAEDSADAPRYVEADEVPRMGVAGAKAALGITSRPGATGADRTNGDGENGPPPEDRRPEPPPAPSADTPPKKSPLASDVVAEFKRLDLEQREAFAAKFDCNPITQHKRLLGADLQAMLDWMAQYTGGVPTN